MSRTDPVSTSMRRKRNKIVLNLLVSWRTTYFYHCYHIDSRTFPHIYVCVRVFVCVCVCACVCVRVFGMKGTSKHTCAWRNISPDYSVSASFFYGGLSKNRWNPHKTCDGGGGRGRRGLYIIRTERARSQRAEAAHRGSRNPFNWRFISTTLELH